MVTRRAETNAAAGVLTVDVAPGHTAPFTTHHCGRLVKATQQGCLVGRS